ncbi:sensor histidine kinase [Lysobacter helvus]|uniref:histidine kinase n=2 Tax=Lysobacteraceae TaxID=32033 RepID=A0ABN6FN82_9GAMM|nr:MULTISPECIES: GAF domain-containing sensor histidine kinase [Lysobacter]BCT90980.1 sensor histidine kinase [Lysobacter caseinilyticus]BCT94133.1 sensor histidine kinase [Lysobacter helvus]
MPRTRQDDLDAIARLPAVDKILRVVARATGMRFTAVARVTDTEWIACAVHDEIDFGLKPGGALELGTTICNEIRQHREPVIFGHASADPHWSQHHTPRIYGLESYISVPIFRRDGTFFGTLCAIDPQPAKLDDPTILETFQLCTDLIAAQLEQDERMHATEAALVDAEALAHWREQFIAILGHDLRSPLMSLTVGTHMLSLAPLDAQWQGQVQRMARSCERMTGLIDDLLDLARSRLGEGIPVALVRDGELEASFAQVVEEVRGGHPSHAIRAALTLDQDVLCDRRRLSQLLANLLVNAATHGAQASPIDVAADIVENVLVVSVANTGTPIADADRARLFQPYVRVAPGDGQGGLGLGLYIAAEIARAHGGTLTVQSSADDGTRFEFRMPMDAAVVTAAT